MTKISGDWLEAPSVQLVCSLLSDAGYQALLVGGAVRNALLGMPVSDLDLTSDAPPEVVTRLAEAAGMKVVPTGLEHGTVTVISKGQPFEITTFRRDVETDGRHARIAYSREISEDAARRDFTINALYARADGTVLDPLGLGLADLAERRLRFVGEPSARIAEDYLRILRFFRFYAWYGTAEQGPDPEALAAIAAGADGLAQISKERIGAEMSKLLAARDPGPALAAMQATGVLAAILPGAMMQAVPVLVHLEEGRAPNWLTRLALLGGEAPADRLRLSRSEVKILEELKQAQGLTPAEAAYRFGAERAEQSVLALSALMEQAPPADWQAQVARGAAAKFPIKAADLFGRFEGPALGAALRAAEKNWIASGFSLDRDALLSAL